jgi:hypothetical protein
MSATTSTEPRTARDLKSREKEARAVWQPAAALPDPTPEPGWSYRWIATAIMGDSWDQNVSTKLREGWEPVKAADHPELMLQGNKNGNVEIGGLMLCKIETERAQARDRYFASQNKAQMDSVDNHFLRNNDPRMPLFSDKKSEVERGVRGFGSGTK